MTAAALRLSRGPAVNYKETRNNTKQCIQAAAETIATTAAPTAASSNLPSAVTESAAALGSGGGGDHRLLLDLLLLLPDPCRRGEVEAAVGRRWRIPCRGEEDLEGSEEARPLTTLTTFRGPSPTPPSSAADSLGGIWRRGSGNRRGAKIKDTGGGERSPLPKRTSTSSATTANKRKSRRNSCSNRFSPIKKAVAKTEKLQRRQ